MAAHLAAGGGAARLSGATQHSIRMLVTAGHRAQCYSLAHCALLFGTLKATDSSVSEDLSS
jgi:hypothetical protein